MPSNGVSFSERRHGRKAPLPRAGGGIDRRGLLAAGIAVALTAAAPGLAADASRRLLLVHGRAQGRREPANIQAEWAGALAQGAAAAGVAVPRTVSSLPFYGRVLDDFVRQMDLPLTSEVVTRGGDAGPDDYMEFQRQVVTELAARAAVSDAEIDAQLSAEVRQRGPENWEWVQAIIQALDQHASGVSTAFLEAFLRDVFLYVSRSRVRTAVDGIVAGGLTEAPTVVVAHSLGTVVAYSLLKERGAEVPLLVTVGSPLGIRAVRNPFQPVRRPTGVGQWINAYDPRDVVALVPLDASNCPVTPAIANIDNIDNQTENRHGIIGYLDKAAIAGPVIDALNGSL
jgi:hypothetical protein